jgi:hypothetical protein
MRFPGREKICAALLVHILKYGEERHAVLAAKTYEPLADQLGLSPSERVASRDQVHGDGRPDPAWHSAVQYARRNLVSRGLISRDGGIGVWMLTAAGVSEAQELVRRGHTA